MEFVWTSALSLLMFAYTFVLLGSNICDEFIPYFLITISLKDILSMLRLGLGCQNASHFLAFVYMCLLTLLVSFYFYTLWLVWVNKWSIGGDVTAMVTSVPLVESEMR